MSPNTNNTFETDDTKRDNAFKLISDELKRQFDLRMALRSGARWRRARVAGATGAARFGTRTTAWPTHGGDQFPGCRRGQPRRGGKNGWRATRVAGKGAGRFARSVQGVERRRVETNRAGIFAAGGTKFRKISGNGQRRPGAAAGSHQNAGRAAEAAAGDLPEAVAAKQKPRKRPRSAR